MTYPEDAYLMLSGIQHFAFCRRQWALIHLEQQWEENVRTMDGNLMHERVHDDSIREKRGDRIITRAMAVSSPRLGLSGECDAVEFHRDKNGIPVFGMEGTFRIVPVEYKRGSPKENDCDVLQLTAQALCLEDMLCCEIPEGFLYYHNLSYGTLNVAPYAGAWIEIALLNHHINDATGSPPTRGRGLK